MKCPYCAELIKNEAKKCKHCGAWLRKGNASNRNDNSSLIHKAPTFEVTKYFTIKGREILHNGNTLPFEGVTGLYFFSQSTSINLVASRTIHLGIDHVFFEGRDEGILLHAESYLIKTKKFKNIERAASILFKETYEVRLQRYINKFNTVGYIEIENGKAMPVRILANGDVESENMCFNLKEAKKTNNLIVGYSSYWGIEGVSDPFEVTVSNTGTAMWNKKIIFEINQDPDVLKTIIFHLSK